MVMVISCLEEVQKGLVEDLEVALAYLLLDRLNQVVGPLEVEPWLAWFDPFPSVVHAIVNLLLFSLIELQVVLLR